MAVNGTLANLQSSQQVSTKYLYTGKPSNKFVQPVNKNNMYSGVSAKIFSMIDNYIYLYHTKTLIAIPTYPESISDQLNTTFASATPLSRSAPIFSFSNAGPRTFQVSLSLHRDMMNDVNIAASRLKVDDLSKEDYVDILIKQLHAVALPRYGATEKKVDPPLIAVRFGSEIFCKGIVNGGITVEYTGPLLSYGTTSSDTKYAQANISFTVTEVDPFDADSVMTSGGFRGLSKSLEKRVYK